MKRQTQRSPIPFTKLLTDIRAADIDAVGGKGANLGELAAAGFPVPPAFCVTTSAFRMFMYDSPRVEEIYSVLAKLPADDLAKAQEVGTWVRRNLSRLPIPEEVQESIHASWSALGKEAAYAVRSSATAEDLPTASFAGQQDTFLNVQGEAPLLAAIKACWISLFTDRAILYRARSGFSHQDVSLSVVVQQMVVPDNAGILFTADPVSGRRNVSTIDASYGLGEALVAGMVSADLFRVDTSRDEIIERKIGQKQVAVRPREGGGVYQELIPTAEGALPSLSDEQVLALAQVGSRIQDHFQAPQDIEWAIAGGDIYILQSRPITSLFPIPPAALEMAEKTGQLQAMFAFGTVQGIMGPMTRLGMDNIKSMFAGGGAVFNYNQLTAANQQVMWIAAERLFINFTAVVRHPLGRKLMRAALDWLEPSVGLAMKDLWDDPRLTPSRWAFRLKTLFKLLHFFGPLPFRVMKAMARPAQTRERFLALINGFLVEIEEEGRQCQDLSDWLDLFDEVTRSGFPTLLPLFGPVMVTGMSTMRMLMRLSRDLPGGEQQGLLLTRGLPHNVTTEMDLALWQTAQAIRAQEEAVEGFRGMPAETIAALYLARVLPAGVTEALDGFMDRYGMRGLGEIDLGRPRWREAPLHIIRVLQSYLQIEDDSLAPDQVFARGAAAAEQGIETLAAAVNHGLTGRLKARQVRFAASRMRQLAGLRESPKFMMVRMFDIVRQGLLGIGQELVAGGILRQADDLFMISLAHLRAYAEGESVDLAALAADGRQAYQREAERRQVPRLLLSDGHAFFDGVGADLNIADGALLGDPVSPGVVEGLVRVVFDPGAVQLLPGEILVCPGTDPAWTPLFLAAGGLVMEVGGLMTHGSVVAREYGIPAVVGVHQATSQLKTGQKIRVDGTNGAVTILS